MWRIAGRISRTHLFSPGLVGLLLTVMVAVSGCSDSDDSAMIVEPAESGISNTSFGVPELLLETRMINLDQLRVLLVVGGQEWPMQRSGDRWSGSFSLPGDGDYPLQVTWFQMVTGIELMLARSLPVNINSNSSRDVRLTDYTTTGSDFDADGDQVSNLAELQAETDPLLADSNSGGTGDTDSIDSRLLNVANNDAWLCITPEPELFAISFFADGSGTLLTSDNDIETQTPLTWTVSGDVVTFSLFTTADSFIGGIEFSGADNFSSETSNFFGLDVGALVCGRGT